MCQEKFAIATGDAVYRMNSSITIHHTLQVGFASQGPGKNVRASLLPFHH